MWRFKNTKTLRQKNYGSVLGVFREQCTVTGSLKKELPKQADVVIIGGGVTGCSILYHLSKRRINAVLLERNKITSGTTWHTGGLYWRLSRPSDIDIKLLDSSKKLFTSLEQETGLSTGWVENGGLFIARTDERIKEYKRLKTFGHYFDIETQMISALEAAKLSPILNPKTFKAALYSPGDGHVDPTMLCSSLIKGASSRGSQVFENCRVTGFLADTVDNRKKITGVLTENGQIKTSCIVNAGGVWGRNIALLAGVDLPLIAMKHAYVVTEHVDGIRNTPNIRDHDGSIYIKIQGETLHFGGYESNPIIVKDVPEEHAFSLYDLESEVFKNIMDNGRELCPVFDKVGVKSNVCGLESFTPDHKPIMGEDPRVVGLFHSAGFNSGGMMFSGGCAEQLAIWIAQGRPEIQMYPYDIRRYTPSLRTDRAWITETSHESYARNYGIVYPNDQRLSGRNHKIDPFHAALIAKGAVMEQAQGWERPGYYLRDRTAPVRGYDWYGYYDHVKNQDTRYEKELSSDWTFDFSKNQHLIRDEALAVRNNVGLFNLSYFTKMYLTGPDAQEAADWLFTANTDKEPGTASYSCSLNSRGGVESEALVLQLNEGCGTLIGPILKGKGYYIVAGGASGYQTVSHFRKEIAKKKFKSVITDITDKLGILSIQGPKSHDLIQSITETPITDENFPPGMSHLIKIAGHLCRASRTSFVGELGYEIHIPVASCTPVFRKVSEAGRGFDLKHAGFRALYSLHCEKGYHLWNYDLRIDDNPLEADLYKVCRKDGNYLGKQHVEKLKQCGSKKRRVFLTLQDEVPLYGMETIWRDDQLVGYLRRGDYGFSLDCSIGIGYIEHPKNQILDNKFLESGHYQIEVMNKKYDATLFLKSPFDPNNSRIFGQYEQDFQEQDHFDD